jgi:hypothetical protein
LANVIHQAHDRDAEGEPAMTDLEPGERAGNQKADGAESIWPPHVLVGELRCEVRAQGVATADVEQQGPGKLHGSSPPVDPGGLEDEEPPAGRAPRRRCGVHSLPVALKAGRGEEQ